MKNIIFEGISGVGKSTLIETIKPSIPNSEIIPDLGYDTPIKNILLDMVSKDILMQGSEKFKTSLYESLLLAANQHYIQEKLKNSSSVNIYDRDFISVLAYQKSMLKSDYDNWEEVFKPFREIILFNLKKVDLLVYMKAPFETCIDRVEKRENRNYSKDEIELNKEILSNMNDEISLFDKNGGNVLYLDGENPINQNKEKVLKKIRSIK